MAKLTISQFICEQYKTVPPVIEGDLSGKTVVVIGANGGIGFEAVKHFALMNPARLILGCRNKQRGDEALAKIEQETGYAHAGLWVIDLLSFASVSAFAKKWETDGGRLDILVENAGIIPAQSKPELTSDGWESSLQVNNLSTSLLALLLLPIMLDTAKKHNTLPRIVVVASEVHYWTTLENNVIDQPNPLRTFNSVEYSTASIMRYRYLDTKLINVLFVRALNDRLPNAPIIVNAVNPGFCISNLRPASTGLRALVERAMEKALAHTSEEGSRQLVWSALGGNENLDELRGAYISYSEVCEPSNYVVSTQGKRAQDKIWDNLIDELAKVEPAVRRVVDKYLTSLSSDLKA